MRELQAIVETYKQVTHLDQRVALATVVKVSGSTYRRPGARMLITQDGYSVGTISGGCLEHDVIIRAQQVMATGESTLLSMTLPQMTTLSGDWDWDVMELFTF